MIRCGRGRLGSFAVALGAFALLAATAAPVVAQEKGGPEEIPDGPGEFLAAGGPDAFGYTFSDNNSPIAGCDYNFIDIASTGTSAGTGDDSVFSGIPIGFTFNYYGSAFTTTNVSTNGYLAFNTSSSSFSNTCPMPVSLNDLQISPFWDDLYIVSGTGPAPSLRYATVGSAPNRIFIVQWNNAYFCCDSSNTAPHLTFQIQLFETSNVIAFMYKDVETNARTMGNSATIGIDGTGAANFLQYSCNNASLADDRAVFFFPPGVEGCAAAAVESVPAVRPWGWVVLALFLTGIGALTLRRRLLQASAS